MQSILNNPRVNSTIRLENHLRSARNELENLQNNIKVLTDKIGSNWIYRNNTYLPGYTSKHQGIKFDSLDVAKNECLKTDDCGGIILSGEKYELRKGTEASPSDKEESWVKPGTVHKS